MRERFPRISLGKLCGWFGITRQAWYRHVRDCLQSSIEEELVIKEVRAIRASHPKMGTRKLYAKLQPFINSHGIKMGRDALFDLLAQHHLLVRRRKRRVSTTLSHHWLRKYPNLIKDKVATRPNEIWVSDITYWKIKEGLHLYISFITDAYSKKIAGYQVADNMEAVQSIAALQMALCAFEGAEGHLPLTHHSDRGIQYCSGPYVKLLKDYHIEISMTETGDPRDNAIAERVNGIIKSEYLEACEAGNLNEAKEILNSVIKLYNEDRPHLSIGNMVPEFVHNNGVEVKKLWKNYYRKSTTIVNQLQD